MDNKFVVRGFSPLQVQAICRHPPGYHDNDHLYESSSSSSTTTPDADKYSIEDVVKVGNHLVMKVRYPNCSSCSYEGNKVMVFLNVKELDALKWKHIDPHFRDPKLKNVSTHAPSPAARFPASAEGWADAIAYAHLKK